MEVRIRGRGVDIVPTRNTHNRRALLFQNKIRTTLKHFGCHPDDIEFSNEKLAMRKSEAFVKFWSDYEECHISFNGCDNLTNITVDDDNVMYRSSDGVLFNKSMTNLIRYPEGRENSEYIIPNSVNIIEDGAFAECNYVRKIIIHEVKNE